LHICKGTERAGNKKGRRERGEGRGETAEEEGETGKETREGETGEKAPQLAPLLTKERAQDPPCDALARK
jgi:hypothetical protein